MAGNKPWLAKTSGRRPAGTRPRRRVLIVCEDTKSACDYFRAFAIDPQRAEVRAVGMGMNTDSLVQHARDLKNRAQERGEPFSEVWCVFDRDNFPLPNYQRAFELATSAGIKPAWANEAFELWYLLHFNYHDTALSRSDYRTKLKPHLLYDKADETVYATLKPHQEKALQHARRLEAYWRNKGERHPERQNPSTSVHHLVEFLKELALLDPVD